MVDVERTIKGSLTEQQVVLREQGGIVGDEGSWVYANPIYRVDERVLLFLRAGSDGSLKTTGLFQGKWYIANNTRRGRETVRQQSVYEESEGAAAQASPTTAPRMRATCGVCCELVTEIQRG